MTSLLLRNVTLNGSRTHVLIDKGVFADLKAPETAGADRVIDAHGMALLPPFYNTHTHQAMALLRGYGDDMALFTWLNDRIWPLEAKLTAHDIYVGSKLAILEMIKSGSVLFNDMYWLVEETIRAAEELGVRALVADTVMDRRGTAVLNEAFARTKRLARNFEGTLIGVTVAPHAVYTAGTDLLKRCANFARDNGLTLHMHLSETAQENADCIKAHGMTPTAYCDSLGLLTEKSVLAHCVHLTDADIEILAKRRSTLSHNPSSNMKLASGVFRSKAVTDAGCRVALGTDGCASNNNVDMREEMKFAALLAKVNFGPEVLPAHQVFDWATRAGADAFGLNAGVIREGAAADALLIRTDNSTRFTPGYNLISDWVYSAQSSSIDTVICNGAVIMEKGHVPGEEKIIEEARAAAAGLLKRASRT